MRFSFDMVLPLLGWPIQNIRIQARHKGSPKKTRMEARDSHALSI